MSLFVHPYSTQDTFALFFRCRSAFKLLEIDQKTNFIQPGHVVLDCGAAPGSWTQIAVTKSNSNRDLETLPVGFVISLDLLQIYPIKVCILKSILFKFKYFFIAFTGCYNTW